MKIQRVNPVWHLDATGSVTKNIQGQKAPFLYSLVMHDPENNTIVPIFDFVSTSHCSITITKYLFSFKKYLEKMVNSKYSKYPTTIVVDFSWALINSILDAFNCCTIRQYLEWSYEIVILKKSKENAILDCLMNTKVYLCSTHFLKLIVSKVEKIKAKREVKQKFILGFSLLQNSTHLTEFENHLVDIYYLFNQQVCFYLEGKKMKISNLVKFFNLDPIKKQLFLSPYF